MTREQYQEQPAAEPERSPSRAAPAAPAPQISAPAPKTTGAWARLRNALIGFYRGLRSLPVSPLPGAAGAAPGEELEQLGASIKQLQRELNRTKSSAASTEQRLLRELEQARESGRAKDSTILRLEAAWQQMTSFLRETREQLEGTKADAERRVGEMKQQIFHLESELARTKKAIEAVREETPWRAQEVSEEALTALRQEVEFLQHKDRQQNADLEGLRGDVARWQSAAADADAALRQARQELVAARAQQESLGELRQKVAATEKQLARKSEEAASLADAERRGVEMKQQIFHLESELARTKKTIAAVRGEAEEARTALRQELELLQQKHQQQDAELEGLRGDVARWQSAAGEADAALNQARQELVAARTQQESLDELRQNVAAAEQQLARKSEEAASLREQLLQDRGRAAEVESQLAGAEQARGEQLDLKRELKWKTSQLDGLREEFNRARTRADELESMVREFYFAAVNPISVAATYTDLAGLSQSLSGPDRENIVEIKQSLDQVRENLRKLHARLSELGLS